VTVFLNFLFIALLGCVALFIKNIINLKIQLRWINEVYNDRISGEGVLEWPMIPDYKKSLYDPFLWKHKPLKEYLKIA
jgi:hypothetical protein